MERYAELLWEAEGVNLGLIYNLSYGRTQNNSGQYYFNESVS